MERLYMNHQSARTREIVRVGRTAILVSVVLALLEALEGVFSGSVSDRKSVV